MRSIGHFIGGKEVKGTSGRTADVFEPMTGDVQAKVALASKAEVRAAVENAKAAQAEWAATNPQRRARVMMKFLELAQRDYDKLADLLAREHGKTVPDAKGDIQRGLEVVEFACGIPHLMKGEYTEGAGPGIDIYSMRQPLGVVAGITPFNFPAMIPMWKFAPAIACGNAFILKPSERDPGVPMMLAALMIEAGLPPGILNVVNGDKEAVDAILDDPDIRAVGFVGSSPIAQYIYERAAATGKRAQCFGGAKNHAIVMPDADMDQTVDALIGAGYGSAGERCMAISVAVPVGKTTADRLMEKLIPRVESLKIGTSIDPSADYGPLVTKDALNRVRNYVDIGIKEGATLAVDGRSFKMQGYENGFYMGGCLFDNVTKDMRIYKEEIFGPVLSVVRANDYYEALALPSDHDYGNGVAIFTRDGDAARDFAAARQCRHGRHQRADPGADRLLHLWRLEEIRLRRPQPAWSGFDPLLHQDQDDHLALAVRRQGGRGVLDPDDELAIEDAIRSQRGPDCGSRYGAGVCRGKNRAACGPLGRGEAFSGRRDARGGNARHRRRLHQGRRRRLGVDAVRRRADLRGAGDGLPDGVGLHLDPQHGVVDDRRVRQRHPAPQMAAEALHDGAARQLLPDRAGLRLGRRGAAHPRGARRRPLCAQRPEAVHLRRRRGRSLCGDGADRRPTGRAASRRLSSRATRRGCRSAPTSARWAGTRSRPAR